jgi:hypothetical protein
MCDVSVSSPPNGLATERACLNWFHALPLTLRKYTQARATVQTHRLLQLPTAKTRLVGPSVAKEWMTASTRHAILDTLKVDQFEFLS